MDTKTPTPISFKAETRPVTEYPDPFALHRAGGICLRGLISNASDALTRMDFEMLTNREVLDPDTPLSIRILRPGSQHIHPPRHGYRHDRRGVGG